MRALALVCLLSSTILAAREASADPGVAAPASPACSLDRHAGVADDDAETVEQIVCAEVRGHLRSGTAGPPMRWRVRVSKLGGKVVLTLAGVRDDGALATDEKQLVLSGLDEVPVAAPRLVEAAGDAKPVADTQDATNIVGLEARVPKKRSSEVHALLAVVGVAALAPTTATGAGAELGLSAGSETWAFVGALRVAGGDATHIALAAGVRHYVSTQDASPFFGIGTGVEHVQVKDAYGGGLAFYGELGIDLLRTHQFGGAASLRVDAPTFAISPGEGTSGPRFYTPVVSTTFAMRF